ncbi:hypothetical protein FA15DRAFT_667070 [Coprinopsis marcescibilis]|uniref:non-specific serine/threonine protein kinase n=1 Tax=Coprinopsis marcescibilis TaxID=230819 RepID=A0A5C3L218_COPMA|nr:hypothetical protein FA15DRAFT_667070 [Coprinopsis marcescibilis]
MASQQAYQAYAQQKGTLAPGQTIAVNKYTVQVERYLSQGGFAHVYLVRTPTPVYNTTHHVLKRIAVANESMLSEVKKEVDIMRVLKGHPTIVHLIDASWHRLPNGTYEVFILMEYCPGGGIIDMMNRRLRERLTEAEILQIFVDVCEGVAFMHNSRPPLLHRDLKVENILQSSSTSYKLCDFGSATTVQRPPANTQEIRALEYDLGRHTTIQYRAPEMIDLYSKRPIDEKSDIWALGVLLYKLCYYTTPFEEHGSLAILNVQYRIPPYPVYSSQMNMLIGSMLREHGTQRPTVFELLKHVHHLRGTKSQFNYDVPVPQPLIPKHRHQQVVPKPTPSPKPPSQGTDHHSHRPIGGHPNGLRSAPALSSSPPRNQGVQAREKVLEAIAPMRRGRPNNHSREDSTSRQPSPHKALAPKHTPSIPPSSTSSKDSGWVDKEDANWKNMTAQAEARERANAMFDTAWKVANPAQPGKDTDSKQAPAGFDNDFSERLWKASNPNSRIPTPSTKGSPAASTHTPSMISSAFKPHSHTGSEALRSGRDKDAFEGLGLMSSIGKPAPTLAEARKLRTGLAIMSTQPYNKPDAGLKPVNGVSNRPTPSPRPSLLSPSNPPIQSVSRSATPNPDGWRGSPSSTTVSPNSATKKDGMPIESRFPSLEELDAQFSATSLYPSSFQAQIAESRTTSKQAPATSASTNAPSLAPRIGSHSSKEDLNNRPSRFNNLPSAPATFETLERNLEVQSVKSDWKSSTGRRDGESRKDPANSQGGSATMRYAVEEMNSTQSSSRSLPPVQKYSSEDRPSYSPSPALPKYSRSPQPDWLTGDGEPQLNDIEKTATGPVVREGAAKRASVIVQSDFKLQRPVSAQYDTTPVMQPATSLPPEEESPTVSRFTKAFPPIDTQTANQVHRNEPLTDNWSPIVAAKQPRLPTRDAKPKPKDLESASSADESEEPEDLGGLNKGQEQKVPSLRIRHKARQSSVHNLVDLWGGGVAGKDKLQDIANEATPKKPVVADKPAVRPKPRPTSLMPPGRSPSVTGRSVSGSPRVSPIQRDPSPKMASTPVEARSPAIVSPVSASTSSSGRSRPQSMFIFPSRSTEPLKPAEPIPTPSPTQPTTLSPTEEATPRVSRRRMSITDMVHRYESIGGKVIAPAQVTAAPLSRKTSINKMVNVPPSQTEIGRVKVLPVVESATPRDEFRPNRVSAEPSKARMRAISTGPTKPALDIPRQILPSKRVSPVEKAPPSPKKSSGIQLSRPTHKQDNPSTVVFPKRKATLPPADDPPPPRPPIKQEPSNSIVFPTRTMTLAQAEEPLVSPNSVNGDDRSASPERPFQGVGKLIDQWQRKSEESEGVSRAPLKRAGLVHGNRA